MHDSNGNPVVEAEGNENIYVVNKKASGIINTLSAINQSIGGGVPLSTPVTFAQSGGLVQSRISQSRDTNVLLDYINERINNIRVTNSCYASKPQKRMIKQL